MRFFPKNYDGLERSLFFFYFIFSHLPPLAVDFVRINPYGVKQPMQWHVAWLMFEQTMPHVVHETTDGDGLEMSPPTNSLSLSSFVCIVFHFMPSGASNNSNKPCFSCGALHQFFE